MLTVGEAVAVAGQLLAAAGLPAARAEVTARCIVQADVWGIGSHGLLRLPFYLDRILAGGYPAHAELETLTDTGPLVAFSGGGGIGHWQLWEAAQVASARCRQFGVAAVSVADSGHRGALCLYTVPGLGAGQLTLAFSNGPAVMPAWGGRTPVLSTSPIAAGILTRPRPAIVDLATSAVARGKIAALAKAGAPVPEGWALDAGGRPTTDPAAALSGMLSPLGGAKGFALAFMVEALAGSRMPSGGARPGEPNRPGRSSTWRFPTRRTATCAGGCSTSPSWAWAPWACRRRRRPRPGRDRRVRGPVGRLSPRPLGRQRTCPCRSR